MTAPHSFSPETLGAREQARSHLFSLFSHDLLEGEWFELRCLQTSVRPARPGPRRFFRSLTALVEAALDLRQSWDVFFGVGLRRCPVVSNMDECPHGQRGADHISRLSTLWGDFDVASADEPNKPHASRESALQLLSGAEPAPAVVVGSGIGLHAYWPLGQPTADLERVEAINRSIRDRLDGDNAIDAARVLRLAGTFSYKHGQRLPVSLLRCPR